MTTKRLIIIVLCIANAIFCIAQRKRAFMVGISHYDKERTGYQWNNIHGKEDVLLLTPRLKKQGFSINSILDDEATYKNIQKGLNAFIESTKTGDVVYLHFSCHGQPFEDKDGDEADGWDESLVPIDAYKNYKKGIYEGANHILDDELSRHITTLRNKIGRKGVLYVVIDACHAGTSSRGEENTRGTMIGFSSNKNKNYNPPLEKKQNYRIQSSETMCNVVFLEACRADQINREVKINGAFYGALSYNVAQALDNVRLSKTPQPFVNAIYDSIKQKGRWPINQNMVIEQSY